MPDRVVDVNVATSGTTTSRYTRDSGQVISTSQSSVTQATHMVRKRVPSGGKAKPYREKPFLHLSYELNKLSGEFRHMASGGVYYDISGQMNFGTYNIRDGGNLFADMRVRSAQSVLIPGPTVGVNPDLLSQAEVKAYNQLKENSGAAAPEFGVWFGERRETAQLLEQAVFGVLNLARSIAQKDYRKSAQVLKDAFGVQATPKGERARQRRIERWLRREGRKAPSVARRTLASAEDAVLTYNLGVTPMLNDLKEAHIRLQTGDLTAKTYVKAVRRHSNLQQGQEVWRSNGGSTTQVTEYTALHGYTVTFRAMPAQTDIAMLNRLNLTNPAAVAFNLTRLSFILDYFVSVGDYLKALDVPLGFVWQQGSRTQVVRRHVKVELKSPGQKVARGNWRLAFVKRSLYTSFPVPIPPLSLKGKDLSFKQSLNTGLIGLKSLRSLLGVG